MKIAGYLLNTKAGLAGEPGLFYNYILAENGLFVEANSPLLEARVCVADALVRGLLPLEEKVNLHKGKIHRYIYDLALSLLYLDPVPGHGVDPVPGHVVDPYHERYLAITWDGEYHLRMPKQENSEGSVKYEVLPDTLLDIHSHGTLGAFFSTKDNEDERGLRLYMVVGKLDTLVPEVEMRRGVYGYFKSINIKEVFDV